MDAKNYYDQWIKKFGTEVIELINQKYHFDPKSKLYNVPLGYLMNLIPSDKELLNFLEENQTQLMNATIFPQYQELWRSYKIKHQQHLNILDIAEDDEEENSTENKDYTEIINFNENDLMLKLDTIENQVAETLGIVRINVDSDYSNKSYLILHELLNTKKSEKANSLGNDSIVIGKLEKIEHTIDNLKSHSYELSSPSPIPNKIQNKYIYFKEKIKARSLVIILILSILLFFSVIT